MRHILNMSAIHKITALLNMKICHIFTKILIHNNHIDGSDKG